MPHTLTSLHFLRKLMCLFVWLSFLLPLRFESYLSSFVFPSIFFTLFGSFLLFKFNFCRIKVKLSFPVPQLHSMKGGKVSDILTSYVNMWVVSFALRLIHTWKELRQTVDRLSGLQRISVSDGENKLLRLCQESNPLPSIYTSFSFASPVPSTLHFSYWLIVFR
jgi:hypothetical protein